MHCTEQQCSMYRNIDTIYLQFNSAGGSRIEMKKSERHVFHFILHRFCFWVS